MFRWWFRRHSLRHSLLLTRNPQSWRHKKFTRWIILIYLHFSTQHCTGTAGCDYRCTPGGGCDVAWVGPPRAGKTKGSCFPDSFGGQCSGTPGECLPCNQAINCGSGGRGGAGSTTVSDSGQPLSKPAPSFKPCGLFGLGALFGSCGNIEDKNEGDSAGWLRIYYY